MENLLGFPRFSFLISKKFDKRAAKRNRVKRIIKEAIRSSNIHKDQISFDFVIIPKKGIQNLKMQQLIDDINQIKAKVKNEKITNNAH